jgi:ABC-type antimicrobial peptide transport system permease subunit
MRKVTLLVISFFMMSNISFAQSLYDPYKKWKGLTPYTANLTNYSGEFEWLIFTDTSSYDVPEFFLTPGWLNEIDSIKGKM